MWFVEDAMRVRWDGKARRADEAWQGARIRIDGHVCGEKVDDDDKPVRFTTKVCRVPDFE